MISTKLANFSMQHIKLILSFRDSLFASSISLFIFFLHKTEQMQFATESLSRKFNQLNFAAYQTKTIT